MNAQQKKWNQQQKELRRLFEKPDKYEEALALFLNQHAALHKGLMVPNSGWSFADEVLSGMTEADLRRIPKNSDHSVAWCFWHMARIEDVTMNVLVDGRSQTLYQEDWLQCMQMTNPDTGNHMTPEEIAHLSAIIDLEALQDYRLAVGRQTRVVMSQLAIETLKEPVDPAQLQRLVEDKVAPEGSGLLTYWGNRTIAGLLLMPPTRHNFIHLNEAMRLKNRRM